MQVKFNWRRKTVNWFGRQNNPTTNMWSFEFKESEAKMVGDFWIPSPEEWTNTQNSFDSNETEIEKKLI